MRPAGCRAEIERAGVHRAIPGLFALPVGRATLAAAKFLAYGAWSVLIAVALPVAILVAGLAAGLGSPDVGGPVRLGTLSLAGAT